MANLAQHRTVRVSESEETYVYTNLGAYTYLISMVLYLLGLLAQRLELDYIFSNLLFVNRICCSLLTLTQIP